MISTLRSALTMLRLAQPFLLWISQHREVVARPGRAIVTTAAYTATDNSNVLRAIVGAGLWCIVTATHLACSRLLIVMRIRCHL